MGKWISKYIPSMYQRRLLLLLGGMTFGGVLLGGRMGQLTVANGAAMREEAEKRLVSREWLDNVRGQIKDRKGRVLAVDRPTLDIAVDYPVITGEWADEQAAKRARALNRGRWANMSVSQREAAIKEALPEFNAQVDGVWNALSRVGQIPRDELEAKRGEIRQDVQLLAAQITERRRREREALLNRSADPGDSDDLANPVLTSDVRRPVREELEPHVILRDVPDAMGFEFQKLVRETIEPLTPSGRARPKYPGLLVIDAKRREYPLDTVDVPIDARQLPLPVQRLEPGDTRRIRVEGVATHILGWMRERIFEEDVARRPLNRADGGTDLGHYRPGDSIGQGGMEQGAEDTLRGVRGVRVTHLDTGEVETTLPVNGTDVQLTIDAMLQARIEALFDPRVGLTVVQPWHKTPQREQPKFNELPLGTALHGAVVVLDIESGDVLAMVTMPTFSHRALKSDPKTIENDAYTASFVNRAIDKPYPPGSIVKPLMLTAAITAGKFGIGDHLNCTGHFYPDKPTLFRCWIYKQRQTTHNDQLGHALSGSDAIKVSCNIFFFELARRLGTQGVHDWYTRYGVGQDAEPWNLFALPDPRAASGLLHVQRGGVPAPDKASLSEAVLMGIGQGPVVWTPLHAADAFATLARGGVKITPRLRSGAAQTRTDLGLNQRGVRLAIDGLFRCANEESGTTFTIAYDMPDGTKHRERIFDVPGVSVWAKSGTADAPPFVADLNFDQNAETFDGDHAWCVGLAGVGREPKYAIAAVIDHGGSGGRVAGPIVNQVIHALVSEGYLPDERSLGARGASDATGGLTMRRSR